eukprot:XP_014020820.1 PREDICTED: nebulin isoform X13 [Salmo salar]
MDENEEFEEEFEEEEIIEEEYFEETVTSTTSHQTTSRAAAVTQQPGVPVRRVVRKKVKVDTSKFMTPYLAHSQKMLDLFSYNKYRRAYDKAKGKPYAITADTPEMMRIKKAQEQLSEVKYRMEGNKVRCTSLYDGEAREIAHVKHVSELISKVLYRAKWDETKDRYLLPPDAPELVLAVKNAANYSKKLYTEQWDEDKTMCYPYSDSPELRRVAKAQEVLSDILYKKGHAERTAKYTSLAVPNDMELAKKNFEHRSDLKYHEDYNKNVKGHWCETPYIEVAVARVAMDNLSNKMYTAAYEDIKDQINFMQTETPEYKQHKKAGHAASSIKYKKDYENSKSVADYNVLPATDNPLLRQLRYAGTILSDKVYKASYEKSRGSSINYCDTPKFKMDSVVQQFSDAHYKDKYENEVKGHYIGSYEDIYMQHCKKMEEIKSEQNYKADYEDIKTRCFYPQTMSPEYEAHKKVAQCKDKVYRQHPDTVKFTQVTDSPVQLQAAINAKQLSDLNYHAAYELDKFKCALPPDYPFFIQSRANAYNLSDSCYRYDWEKVKAKQFEVKGDAISILAARAHTNIASDVKYKKEFEKNKGKMVGALSIHDDPKILHSMHVAKIQSDREYKKNYEKTKTKYITTLDMMSNTLAKKSQGIASMTGYRTIHNRYLLPHDAMSLDLAKKANIIQSDNEYHSDYNNSTKGTGWVAFGSMEVEKAKKAGDILNERKYRQHPDTVPFTSIADHPVMMQAQVNQIMRSDLHYKKGLEEIHQKYSLPHNDPQFLQAKCNAYNISKNYYKQSWEETIAKGYDMRPDAISVIHAKHGRHIASDIQYKKDYVKGKGKQIGCRNLQDDPLLVHYMEVARLQSDKNYKKDYHKSKLKYHSPVDMMSVVHAKHASTVQTFAGYRKIQHHYSLLPGAMNLELARTMNTNASDVNYKADWENSVKGTGWIPIGSIPVELAKQAGAVLDEHKYRQHPENFKFSSKMDGMNMELCKHNQKIMNVQEYKASGEKFLHTYNLPADAPEFMQAKCNAVNISKNYYTYAHRQDILKGHQVKADAIPILAARACTNIASNYKYKLAYEKGRGKHVGFRNVKDDPLLVHYMEVAKMQSEQNYKKDYHKSKLKYHSPVDMMSLVHAKHASAAQTFAGYRKSLHNYTLLPEAMPVQLARTMMEIQSNNAYKSDYNNMCRGSGWVPIGSMQVELAKTAMAARDEQGYRVHPSTLKFTSLTGQMNMALAMTNTKLLDDASYRASGEKFKHTYNLPADSPQFLQAKCNAQTMSESHYKHKWVEDIAKGYDIRPDAISVIHAKHGRHIASDIQYKKDYVKGKGKQIGCRNLQDDPLLVHYMEVAKMQSDKNYKKDYHKSKLKYHSPVDMMSLEHAKHASTVQTFAGYRKIQHHYTLTADSMNLALARTMNASSSDYEYKSDWNNSVRGTGWIPIGSLPVELAKVGGDIQSEQKYRTHPSKFQFKKLMDSMDIVLATDNNKIMNKQEYTKQWHNDKLTVHVMPDAPEIVLAKANAINMSQKTYKAGLAKMYKNGYDLKVDAIAIQAAKQGTKIASDYKYKLSHRMNRGKQIGCRNLQDDPLLVHYMEVARLQSDKNYKKDYHKSKLKYHSPVDMMSVVHAKHASTVQTFAGYRKIQHHYTVLADAMNVELAKQMQTIASDNLYKSDYETSVKGTGWIPIGSLDVEKAKTAGLIGSEKLYRQHPSSFKFTKDMHSMDVVLANANNAIMNKQTYVDAWNKDKTSVHIMPDSMEVVLARANKINCSATLYKLANEQDKKKGYDLRNDAIAILAAKQGTSIASDFKYRAGYRKQVGHHIGARCVEEDPLLMLAINSAKIASDALYKKDFHQSKTKFHLPLDMIAFELAKKNQIQVNHAKYVTRLHNWTCLPDSTDVVHARHVYDIASDAVYKADLKCLQGIGWVPIGSLDVEKAKKAGEVLSEKLYRQHPSNFKFTSSVQDIGMVLAKQNNDNANKQAYTEAWETDKTKNHIMPDAMDIVLANANKSNYSWNQYRKAMVEDKKKGYDMRNDAISIIAAKHGREIISDHKYKSSYRKQVGHHIGARCVEDDPLLVLALNSAKIASDALYKKDFHQSKTKFHLPLDMIAFELCKKNQIQVNDFNYRTHLHNWTCLPDSTDVVHARHVYDIASEAVYRADMKWLRGIGWVPTGSLDVEKAKKAGEILSEKKYRQHPSTLDFKSPLDGMDIVLAKHNGQIMNKRQYVEQWDADKIKIHVGNELPELVLAKANAITMSNKLYKQGFDETIKKGYYLPVDAISVKAAKHGREIISDYKYKAGYSKQVGHHIGARCVEEDPLLMLAINSAKIASDALYKKDFHQSKTKFHLPLDMIAFELCKKNQIQVNDFNYRTHLHNWTCLPDSTDVVHARRVYDLHSDAVYRADMEFIRGTGWVPIGSLDVLKAKKAAEILSDRLYKQKPDSLKYTTDMHSMPMVLAKANAEIINKGNYVAQWEADKIKIHVGNELPELVLAKANAINNSYKLYKAELEELYKKGYNLKSDCIAIKAAKHGREIISDYKYKAGYSEQVGHHIGARCVEEDPLIMLALNSAKIASDALYKKDFHQSKTKFHLPVDMLTIELAKKCQMQVNDFNYRTRLHNWTCLPDSSDVVQARKVYALHSDAVYRADMEWLKGTGWVPIGSIDVEKAKKAGEILSERKYREHPSNFKFTATTDDMPYALATANAQIMDKRQYVQQWEADKIQIHVGNELPELVLAKANAITMSNKLYREGFNEMIGQGYHLDKDAIAVQHAKKSREIISDYKYKAGFRNQCGHHIGAHCVEDDPLLVLAANAARISSDINYKKDFHLTKTKFSIPLDMMSFDLAKKSQFQIQEFTYRTKLHNWTCMPDNTDVVRARKVYSLHSDAVYRADLEWLRGCGWLPQGSVDVIKAKNAQTILNERLYRQPPSSIKFTSVVDSPEVVLSKQNADILSDRKYREVWDTEKTNIHLNNDLPSLVLSKANAIAISNKLYTKDWDADKAKGYHIKEDAIAVLKARKSRDIISDYKYHEGYRKQVGHHIGARCVEEDPLIMLALNSAKIASDALYKKDFNKSKTKFHLPVDMLTIELAKKCQVQVNDFNYRTHLHNWTCLPDSTDVVQARKTYDLQSDAVYKADLEWLRGCGWNPHESVEVLKVKHAQAVLADRGYRVKLDQQKFTAPVDRIDMVCAKNAAEILNEANYRALWHTEKTKYTITDTPGLATAREVAKNLHPKLYTKDWDKVKATGFFMPGDAVPIKQCIHNNKVQSDHKYKADYRKQAGHHIGARCVEDDPLIMLAINSAKIASDALYKKDFNKSKTKFHLPVDMLTIELAKKCQVQVNDDHYRTRLHNWTCLPDSTDVTQARKAYDLQSDVVYKADLEWLRGCGWVAADCVDHVKVRNAQKIMNERLYKKDAKDNFAKYTHIVDRPEIILATINAFNLSDLKYKETFNAEKGKYIGSEDTPQLAHSREVAKVISEKYYKLAWDESKATGYQLDAHYIPVVGAKKTREIVSDVKYHDTHEKAKGHYLAGTLVDFPEVMRCGEQEKQKGLRDYHKEYNTNKAKNHIPADIIPNMVAKRCQDMLSDVLYRTLLHNWTCHPDQQDIIRARKNNEILSDVYYKDDLNWIKGIGCYAWDTPELVRAKNAHLLQSDNKYRAKGIEAFKDYSVVIDTPTYETAKLSSQNLSDLHYRNDYATNVKGTNSSPAVTVDTERARLANFNQSDNLYKEANKNFMPTGYSLPHDNPLMKQAKQNSIVASSVKYKNDYEKSKATNYTMDPDGVSFVNIRNANKVTNPRLYRELYEKGKGKIHSTYDTPEIRQVKMTQEAVSDLCYKEKYFANRGTMIPMGVTPQMIHCNHVNEITSDLRYKEDLLWLRGIGCFLYDTPEMSTVRNITKFRSNYEVEAKKNHANFTVVLDTPEYQRVTELKTHMSDLMYRAQGNVEKTKCTTTLDSLDVKRVKWAQQLSNKYMYTDLASKERAHFTPEKDTPIMSHARAMKVVFSEIKYKDQYEKMKHKYTSIHDTPILVRAKKAYLQSSDLRYKESFERSKGHYHSVKDALDIVCHRRVTDDISEVKYREKYINSLGTWRSMPDRPEFFHSRIIGENVSDIKYKEDLDWLKGIGCYVWDRPEMVQAEKNKVLFSERHYKETFEKNRHRFKYTCDTPFFQAAKKASVIINDRHYRAAYEKTKDKYSSVLDDPRNLLAKENAKNSQWKYREQYERAKNKFTSILETPEHESHKRSKAIGDNVYKMDYNKNKAKGYTLGHDTPHSTHMKKVKEITSVLKYKELYEKSKAQINMDPESFEIRAAKEAYKNISNLDYRKKYQATKNKWIWTVDRPDFIQAAKANFQQSDIEYTYDKEMMKGCVISIVDDKLAVLAKMNADLSNVKYREKFEKAKGQYKTVLDTPTNLHAKSVRILASESKYKLAGKMEQQTGQFTTLPTTRDTIHAKDMGKLVSEKQYKQKFEKEKGKSKYNSMRVPPDVQHAMDVAKNQSNFAYRQEAKAKLNYTSVAMRPDIMRATQASKLASNIGYREKARQEAAHGGSLVHRPDIALATAVSKLNSQEELEARHSLHGAASIDTPQSRHLKKMSALTSNVQYKAKYDKEKGLRPKYDMKESVVYKTQKDAHQLASEVKYKGDLKKLHKPVTDMAESLSMQHNLSTSKLSSDYQYKKKHEDSKGHYLMIADSPEQLHHKEASELQSHVKYKEKYEKAKGKAMLDFETPTYVTAKEAQHMQSAKDYHKEYEESIKGKNLSGLEVTPAMLHVRHATKIASERDYRRDLEEGVKGKGLTVFEETPELLRARNATAILSQKEYKKTLETEIKGKGMLALATDTPDFMRARNATDILSQQKYKQTAEADRASYTSVIDTPDILHAQNIRNMVSQKKYREEAEKCMSHYVPVLDTPEMMRVRENQKNFSTIKYKDLLCRCTAISDLPEVKRVREMQKNISSVLYKDSSAKGTPQVFTPEMERAKRNQEQISSVLYSDSFRKQVQGKAAFVLDTPEMRRVKETQRNISGVKYHQDFEKSKGSFTPTTSDPVMDRVKKNTQEFSDINYRGIQRRVVEMEKRRVVEHEQETVTDLRVWRTNPGSVFDYDPAEDNIQSRSLHMMSVQAQRRSKEHSRSTSAMSGVGDEKSEVSEDPAHHVSLYSNGFATSSMGYTHTKTVELQQRSSSVATQQTTVSSVPSHPSTTGKTVRAMYDYSSADMDEVSFKDGDVIVNVQSIDEGWMYGTVQRSGKTGMLPANYVEAI